MTITVTKISPKTDVFSNIMEDTYKIELNGRDLDYMRHALAMYSVMYTQEFQRAPIEAMFASRAAIIINQVLNLNKE